MKQSFKFKYSALIWVLLAIVVALSLAGVVWNVYNLICFINAGAVKVATYVVLVLATSALFVIVLSIAFFGRYTVNDKALVMHMGVFATKFPIDEIVEITHFKKSDKLVVYFNDAKYSVLLISPAEYEPFVLAVRSKNTKIVYDARIEGEDTPL